MKFLRPFYPVIRLFMVTYYDAAMKNVSPLHCDLHEMMLNRLYWKDLK